MVSPFVFPADGIPCLLLQAIESLILLPGIELLIPLPHESLLNLADMSLFHTWKQMKIVPLQITAIYWMFPVPLFITKIFCQVNVFTAFVFADEYVWLNSNNSGTTG